MSDEAYDVHIDADVLALELGCHACNATAVAPSPAHADTFVEAHRMPYALAVAVRLAANGGRRVVVRLPLPA